MKTIVYAGKLFSGLTTEAATGQAAVIEHGRFTYVGPREAAPAPQDGDQVVDFADKFLMPGLSDLHTHLSYGNALGQEDIDLYATMEYRALRALAGAQRMLAAGFTALMDPASSGHVAASVRDAQFVGMFPAPRITAAGPAITSRLGLYDFYPSWVGVPPESSGVLVKSLPEAIEEIRRQTKDGMDVIKIAMDGIYGDKKRGLYAAFDQAETTAMVREGQRLGRKVVVHVRGREGCLYAARAGADIIFHASRIDAEGIAAAKDNGCSICPSLMLLVNNIAFAGPADPSASWWPDIQRQEFAAARVNLGKAYEAGIPFLTGSESGFAVTPYGEWAAGELEVMVRDLGLPAGEVLRMATAGNRALLRDGDAHDTIAPGKRADFVVVDGDPLADIACLQERRTIAQVWMDGAPVALPNQLPAAIPRHPRELAQGMWSELYTRAAVAGRRAKSLHEFDGPGIPLDDEYPEAAQ
jgi:imidazolonepropionase-like amidohydrolase